MTFRAMLHPRTVIVGASPPSAGAGAAAGLKALAFTGAILLCATGTACTGAGRSGNASAPVGAAAVGDRVALRHNLLGYSSDRPKNLRLMSDKKLDDVAFRVTRDGATVLDGQVSSSGPRNRGQRGFTHNASIDISALRDVGEYRFELTPGADNQGLEREIRVLEQPYAAMATQLLSHLRVARSGSEHARLHPLSHPGDARAIVHRTAADAGDPGRWIATTETVDALGGWYDAGDYIKFSSTNALTAYYLLRAYELAPALHERKELSQSDWVDILDEAKHGLDYLAKLQPNDRDFIVQVGSKLDHEQPQRLPHEDRLDGQRKAFSAPQAQTIVLAVAALSLGARVFRERGAPQLADHYLERASAMAARAQQPDVLDFVAYDEKWFYPDESVDDNTALGAVELHRARGDADSLAWARSAANAAGPGGYVSWETLNLDANYRLEAFDPAAAARVDEDLKTFSAYAQSNAWGVPMKPVWGGLYNYFPIGAVAAQRAVTAGDGFDFTHLAYDALDYTLGRNRWGVSFFASPDIEGSAKNFYSQIYRITGEFPVGAVSEGPLGASDHAQQMQHFGDAAEIARLVSENEFNTEDEVFVDHDRNYATMETTIFGQAGALYLISALHALENR